MFRELLNSGDGNLAMSDRLQSLPTSTTPFMGYEGLKGANIASVPHYSPFRYPGGKTWLANILRRWLAESHASVLYEPFAGGASTSLLAVIEGFVPRAVLIEKDVAVAAVWKTILSSDANWLIDKIMEFRISSESVDKVLRAKTRKTRTLAFQTIIKNRCRRGGVIAGGAGLIKRGERDQGIKSRWYPETLAKRIQLIHQHKEKLEIREGDAFNYFPELLKTKSAKFFVDPPYSKLMTPGVKPIYSHCHVDHRMLCQILASARVDYLLTYDDTNFVRQLLAECGLEYCTIDMKNSNAATRRELLVSNEMTKFGH